MKPSRRVPALLLGWLAVAGPALARAETFRENFDGDATSWRVESDGKAVKPFDHRRQRHLLREGKGAEIFKAEVGPGGGEAALVHSLPPAAAIEDLRLSVWIRSNQPGLQLHLRLVFPDGSDPESGGPLTALLAGGRYTTPGEWQELTCSASREAIQDAVRRTRYRLDRADLGDSELYVDQAVLSASFSKSPAEVVLDDLTLANVVPAAEPNKLLSVGLNVPEPDAPVEFRLSRLLVEGKPFFPILAEFHGAAGETVEAFAAAGMNVASFRDYRDDALLEQFRSAGLWATAVPPRPEDDQGRPIDPRTAGMLPFGPETRPILFWNLGPRVKPEWIDEVIGWVNQLRAADTAYRRPVLADVTGSEYAFSRHVDMLAESRHITNTAISYRDYRDWMRNCRTGAFLNTFFWTWVQTEPAEKTVVARAAAGHQPVVIEPEQIRQQVYAALQAGCRGLGYWMTAPIGADAPGSEERRLAITRLNLELELLEPLLATGARPGEPFGFVASAPDLGSSGHRTRPAYHQLTITGPKAAETPFAPSERPPGPAEAVLLGTDLGPLLIAVWYGEGAQFCPGKMAAPNVNIVVPGIDETASAWLLTPTGLQHLPVRRVAGGKQVTLRKFDQTAVILFTSDREAINRFHRKAAELKAECAQVSLDLARVKRTRVAAVYGQLAAMAAGEPDGPAMMRKADNLITDAEKALARNDHDGAREAADDALQMLRYLQRLHWESAVRQFASPLASPHAVCFSTLPDHYRLIAKFGRGIMSSSQEPNLMPSGDFEEQDRMIEEGWQHFAGQSDTVRTAADLRSKGAKQGAYSLCLSADRREGMTVQRVSEASFVSMQSPPVPVTAGQVLHVSGWIRIAAPIPSRFDGAKLHDSLLGPSSGLRWAATEGNGWKQFEMLREVPSDGDFSLTLTLQGIGEVYFDDLRVVALAPRTQIADQPPATKRTARQ